MKLGAIAIGTLCWLGWLGASGAAEASGLDERCQVGRAEEWQVKQAYNFIDRGRSYQLVYSQGDPDFQSLCVVSGKSAQPVNFAGFIDRLDRVNAKVFTLQVHEGNGNRVPVKKYRLNLTQPQAPKLILIQQWTSK